MIIDHIDNMEISDEVVEQHFNEIRSLNYLATGLGFLNAQVQMIEAKVTARLPEDQIVSMFGNAPELEGIPQDLVACAFHWYSVTACNYVKLVGWLSHGGNSDHASKYLQRVIPEVYLWRNKVGAHFARIDPHKEDSPADLAASVMFPIGFIDDSFRTTPIRLTLASGEPKPTPPGIAPWRRRLLAMSGRQKTSSRRDMQWSLTDTHKRLASRYWPGEVR